MFNRLLKLTIAGLLWNRYGSMILSTVLLFLYFWIVSLIHQDYLDYLALQESSGGVGLSFILKWLAYIAGVIAYWLFNSFVIKRTARKRGGEKLETGGASTDARKPAGSSKGEDPFDAIRHREKLRSKADLLIERHEHR